MERRAEVALAAAHRHEEEIVTFLRDMIAIPAESGREQHGFGREWRSVHGGG